MDRRTLPALGTAGLMFAAFITAVFQENVNPNVATVFFTIAMVLLGILIVQIVAVWLKDLILEWLFLQDVKKNRENLQLPQVADDEEGHP